MRTVHPARAGNCMLMRCTACAARVSLHRRHVWQVIVRLQRRCGTCEGSVCRVSQAAVYGDSVSFHEVASGGKWQICYSRQLLNHPLCVCNVCFWATLDICKRQDDWLCDTDVWPYVVTSSGFFSSVNVLLHHIPPMHSICCAQTCTHDGWMDNELMSLFIAAGHGVGVRCWCQQRLVSD